jgi:hypothetical protein
LVIGEEFENRFRKDLKEKSYRKGKEKNYRKGSSWSFDQRNVNGTLRLGSTRKGRRQQVKTTSVRSPRYVTVASGNYVIVHE